MGGFPDNFYIILYKFYEFYRINTYAFCKRSTTCGSIWPLSLFSCEIQPALCCCFIPANETLRSDGLLPSPKFLARLAKKSRLGHYSNKDRAMDVLSSSFCLRGCRTASYDDDRSVSRSKCSAYVASRGLQA